MYGNGGQKHVIQIANRSRKWIVFVPGPQVAADSGCERDAIHNE